MGTRVVSKDTKIHTCDICKRIGDESTFDAADPSTVFHEIGLVFWCSYLTQKQITICNPCMLSLVKDKIKL